ncbi:MAG: hypothetical protein WBB27_00385 [Maribacter sp.]
MKAHATLKNMDSESCKPIISRNLNRILDIRIIDIDVEHSILHFLYNGNKAFEKVKNELGRIGYPILECINEGIQDTINTNSNERPIRTINRARKPYLFSVR